ncbi:hydantoinase/carbamoylase family amidase [Natrialba chahannaoensis JCM 10990]|uniref:Hydantoinase/carbamoylase family amidase n=1 Tax=Natrialba chahannaoensis JCM 10990 TaxID=1227492 RepID=M0B1Y2_9EURY|nr:hydantoinase/carbamoylase family amidase [Natrialba chahannaoensis JCM 10990]
MRALQDADVSLRRPIDVVCFTEEEGARFSDGVLGSAVATGQRSVDDALSLEAENGTTLEESLAAIGFHGDGRLDASAWDSWLEIHIEQNDRLETVDVPLGVVTTITGTVRLQIEIIGEANHSGSTKMSERQDALAAASEIVLDLEAATSEAVERYGDTVVGTAGKLDVEPNAINVVPGKVELGIDVRDIEYASMEYIIGEVKKELSRIEQERGVVTTFKRPYDIEPISMSDRCIHALSTAAETAGIESIELHSGAGHDTMHVAKVTESGLIFAPSHNGISHSPMEWTEWCDCVAATQVLASALAKLAH